MNTAPTEVTPTDVLAFAAELGANSRAAGRALEEMTEAIGAEADRIMGEFEKMTIPRTARAGALRVLTQIRQIPIREMVSRLLRGAR